MLLLNDYTDLTTTPKRLITPNVNDVLREIGPMPSEALFLGLCGDDLPLLTNMEWNSGKPLFIHAPASWGKTYMLKVVLKAALTMGSQSWCKRDLAPIVLTDRMCDWMDMTGYVTVKQIDARNISLALRMASARADQNRYGQYSLILVDGWDSIPAEMQQWFHADRTQRICKIITSRQARSSASRQGLDRLDPTARSVASRFDDGHSIADFTQIWQGFRPGQFVTMEGDHLLYFYVPSLPEGG